MTIVRRRVQNGCRAGLAVLALCALFEDARGADAPEIAIGPPTRVDDAIHVDYSLDGLFDDEIVTAIESGLPATLAVSWRLYRYRSILWDVLVDQDATHHRILYDVLDEQFSLFDESGRRTASCRTLDDVSRLICISRTIVVPGADRLKERHRYSIVIDANLEPLDLEDIRNLEGWLSGGDDEESGEGALSALSDHTMQLLKDLVGLGGRSVRGRTQRFHGWR